MSSQSVSGSCVTLRPRGPRRGGGASRAAGLSLAAAIALAPAPAVAFEIFGLRFFESDAEEQQVSPDAIAYEAEFVVSPEDSPAAKAVRRASELWAGREEPAASTPALLSKARNDYANILAALYAAGYYGGVISIRVDGREAADIPVDATLRAPASVAIRVETGPRFTFGAVSIENRPGAAAGDPTLPPTAEEVGLATGETARSTVVLRAEGALVDRWREKGHPKARVAERRASAIHRDRRLDVAILMDPGRFARFGPIDVTGTETMHPGFVAWYTGLEPGEPYDPDDIERARDQLRRLGVFQAMRFVEAEDITPDGLLPMTVQVSERPLRVVGFGASYSTLDGVGVEGYWRHRNLFGRAESLRIEGRISGLDSDDISNFNYLAAVTFRKPGVFTPFSDFTARVFTDRDNPDTYVAERIGGRLGLSHRPTTDLTLELAANVEGSRISEAPIGNGDFLLASIPATFTYDRTDSELDPTRGWRARGRAEPFHEFQFENTGIISELTASTYVGLPPNDRVVLAFRASAGSLAGAPLDEIPANRLFFAGGGGSIRGYDYRSVGPRLPDGRVTGGRSYFTGSAEARVSVTDTIGVVPFVDFGNAFRDSFPDFSEELRVGAGIGLRYDTGLGPLRFDVATPVDRREGDPTIAFYLGLGQAF